MQSRIWLNIGLLLLLAGLTALTLYEPGLEQPQPSSVSTLRAADIESVRIEVDDSSLTLQRVDDQWWIESTPRIAANHAAIERLLRLPKQIPRRSYGASELNAQRIGLDPPQKKLWLDEERYDFGGTEAIEGDRYVRKEGRIYLLADIYYPLLGTRRDSFAARRLLNDQERIRILEQPGLRLLRTDAGGWRTVPADAAIDTDSIHARIEAWQSITATSVRAADTALATREAVQLFLEERESPVLFEVHRGSGELILVRPEFGLAYHFPQEAAARLLGDAPPPVPAATDQAP